MLPVIGLPLGKLQYPTFMHMLERGIELPEYVPSRNSRCYQIDTGSATFVLDNSRDLVKRVMLGDLDAAIVGGDTVAEAAAEREEAKRFGVAVFHYLPEEIETIDLSQYLNWRLVVLARQNAIDASFHDMLRRLFHRDIRYPVFSWTEFPYSEKRLIEQLMEGLDVGVYPHSVGEVTIFTSSGSTESKLKRGDSMFGLEIVSSGETSRLNELRSFDETAREFQPVAIKPRGYSNSFVQELIDKLAD